MNTMIFLKYDFNKIIFKMNNKNNWTYKYIYNNNINKGNEIITKKNTVIIKYDWNIYITNKIKEYYPFLIFYLINLLGNKTGKYIAKNFVFNS